ncbi:MAG: methyltransferase domain-containing protein [Alphaproteobacteria bacterium]|nr:methyltransferase domain-containing protein [Alphaproteobacteria bacterium]
MPGDIAGLASLHGERLAGVVLCVPTRLDPAQYVRVGERVLMISGARGLTADVTSRAAERLAGAERHVLADYDAPGWADVVADRTAEIVGRMSGFLRGHAASVPTPPAAEGMHAEITYRIEGSGPALLLLPFFLAPSQWAPAMPELTRRFTVITLGGPHLGGVAALEDRARAPTYQAMFRTLIDIMAPKPGEAILDVGCGAGSLDRLLAKRLGSANPITAMDTNAFLLREAATLARAEGVDGTIRFVPGDAEMLPFPDASFDCAFSVTVLEECDADRAIAEMKRVVKPGGRIGIVVRALDMPQWWNLQLPQDIAEKIVVPPQSVAAKGVADASLYRRMREAGLVALTGFPSLITLDRPEGPIWRYREDHALSLLSADQMPIWRATRDAAEQAGLLFMAHPMHCAVGVKPA